MRWFALAGASEVLPGVRVGSLDRQTQPTELAVHAASDAAATSRPGGTREPCRGPRRRGDHPHGLRSPPAHLAGARRRVMIKASRDSLPALGAPVCPRCASCRPAVREPGWRSPAGIHKIPPCCPGMRGPAVSPETPAKQAAPESTWQRLVKSQEDFASGTHGAPCAGWACRVPHAPPAHTCLVRCRSGARLPALLSCAVRQARLRTWRLSRRRGRTRHRVPGLGAAYRAARQHAGARARPSRQPRGVPAQLAAGVAAHASISAAARPAAGAPDPAAQPAAQPRSPQQRP